MGDGWVQGIFTKQPSVNTRIPADNDRVQRTSDLVRNPKDNRQLSGHRKMRFTRIVIHPGLLNLGSSDVCAG